MCAYNVWVISSLLHLPLPPPLALFLSPPSRNYSAIISNFVEERV
jgi:hypothetical protein